MFSLVRRRLCTSPGVISELSIKNKLIEACKASHVVVKDTSGGCGSFFNIYIVSSKFEGIPLVKQHRMVKEALKEEVGSIHGLSITTRTPLTFEKDMQSN